MDVTHECRLSASTHHTRRDRRRAVRPTAPRPACAGHATTHQPVGSRRDAAPLRPASRGHGAARVERHRRPPVHRRPPGHTEGLMMPRRRREELTAALRPTPALPAGRLIEPTAVYRLAELTALLGLKASSLSREV